MDPIVKLDNDNDINIDLDRDDMEMEGIDGPLSKAGDEVLAHLLGNPSASSHGTGNLSRHLKTYEKTTTRDLGQMFLSQSESSMSLRATKFDPANIACLWDSKVDDVVELAIEKLGEELSLLDVGQNAHRVASDDVEKSLESASNGGNGPSGSGV
ncbi:hypothetical protein GIB67_025578 [Kingdonia uniflora]|uniref:Uncharacterized protein n=1 Tax=Kingdonia uniflora TaxID=39325 RepID=A0A7J7M0F9_9MAGN|nr:hypothetical protein GIB67_025578 [Kingdonia uniflora]